MEFARYVQGPGHERMKRLAKPLLKAAHAVALETYANKDFGTPEDQSAIRTMIAVQVLISLESAKVDNAMPGIYGAGAAVGTLAGREMLHAGTIFDQMAAGFQRMLSQVFNTLDTKGEG